MRTFLSAILLLQQQIKTLMRYIELWRETLIFIRIIPLVLIHLLILLLQCLTLSATGG